MQRILIALAIVILVALFWRGVEYSPQEYTLGGGPEGGTFLLYTKGLVKMLQQRLPDAHFEVTSSGGSVTNLIDLEKGRVDLTLAYAGDIDLGRRGQLENHPKPLKKIVAVARVYGSTAQLVVLADSVIKTPENLVNRRVAIGSSGSGAAHSAERYFRILGIWDEIIPIYMGYDMAMKELANRSIQAVWQMVGAPSASIADTGTRYPLRLIDLGELADQSDFLLKYPFYTKATIPAGTYVWQTSPVGSFQDNTLLVARPDTDPQLIDTVLNLLFSPEGMKQMREVHPIGKELDPKKALQGVQIPLHPAAADFWRERGMVK